MHPPLDRPHPMCQDEIEKLRTCHATQSKLKFWACNELKFALDKCFKMEKQELLKQINSDYDEKRKQEDEALRDAIGHEQSFEDFLKNDKTYLKEMEAAKSLLESIQTRHFHRKNIAIEVKNSQNCNFSKC